MFNRIEKNKIFFKRNLLSVVCMLCMVACGTNKDVEAEAEKIVQAVENKEMKNVEKIIFGARDLVADEELAEFFTDSENEGNGIISKIIEHDSIKVKKITDECIVYEITAPELSDIFNNVMKKENLTTESFEKYIYNYIATADKIKMQVEVPYTYEDGVFSADYSTQEFMNGITGNLITAYQDLIQQMIQENSRESVE